MHVLYFKGNLSDHGMINVRALQMFDNKKRCRRCDGSTCSTLALPVSTPMPMERWDKHLFAISNFKKNKNSRSLLSCSGPASPSSCRVPRNGQICLDQRAQEQGDGWVEEVVRWNYSGDDKESGQSGQCGKLVRSPRRPVVPVLHAGRVRQRAAALEEDQRQGAGRHDWPWIASFS